MFGIKKHKVLTFSVIINLLLVFSCTEQPSDSADVGYEIHGEAQGTTYSIIISDSEVKVKKHEIDSLLKAFDQVLSIYVPTSLISQINACEDSMNFVDGSGYFIRCYNDSRKIYELSNGAFDPSVYPLVDGWGFLQNLNQPLEKTEVDSILQFVSFEQGKFHRFQEDENAHVSYQKLDQRFKLDFNAIAQGLSVDVLAEFLEDKGCKNYYVELGGELRLSGKNREGKDWRIGIDAPMDSAEERILDNILNVTDKAVATSGNYRKFYVKDGVKYSHTIDPKTGFPVNHSLLSATVITDQCSIADALATTFMVLGKDKSIELLKKIDFEVEVYLIYADEKGEMAHWNSNGLSKMLDNSLQ